MVVLYFKQFLVSKYICVSCLNESPKLYGSAQRIDLRSLSNYLGNWLYFVVIVNVLYFLPLSCMAVQPLNVFN